LAARCRTSASTSSTGRASRRRWAWRANSTSAGRA